MGQKIPTTHLEYVVPDSLPTCVGIFKFDWQAEVPKLHPVLEGFVCFLECLEDLGKIPQSTVWHTITQTQSIAVISKADLDFHAALGSSSSLRTTSAQSPPLTQPSYLQV
jgi:hypothetical protein